MCVRELRKRGSKREKVCVFGGGEGAALLLLEEEPC